MSSKDIVQQGSHWRIGNREKVSILSDNWLPRSPSFRLRGQYSLVNTDARVCELIDSDLGQWNQHHIFSTFDLETAK